MKILHISSESSWRGGEQQLAYLLEELQKKGIDLLVACKKHSAFEAYCQHQGIAQIPLRLKNSLDIASALQLKHICRQHKPDLLHVHSSRGHSLAYLAHLFGTNIPLLLTRRVAFPIRKNTLNRLRYNSSQLHKIICISEAVKISTAPIVKKQDWLEVIYDGIDLRRFENTLPDFSLHKTLGLPTDTPLIGTVAALTAEKDLPTFVRVACELQPTLPKAHFILIGDGPEQAALEALCTQLGVRDKVHFLGRRTDIPQLLPQLKLFLFTPKMEGLGTSILDAFACKVPVVATAAGGVPEIVLHEKTGLLAPVGDATALAAGAVRILGNSALQQRLSHSAHLLLLSIFTKERMAAETVRVYQEILEKTMQP